MEQLRWIFADATRHELCECIDVDYADVQISQSSGSQLIENTWTLRIPESVWKRYPVSLGCFCYCAGTEIGGEVNTIEHNTEAKTITLSGTNWRGMLYQKAIMPPAGEAYLEFRNVDALQMVRDVIGNRFGSAVQVASGTYGLPVSASFRYQTIANGLQNTLRQYGLKLILAYDNDDNVLNVSVGAVNTITDILEISQDYGVEFTAKKGNIEATNHCLALGQGELTERLVMNVYRVGDQFYTEQPQSLTEPEIRTIILDYPGAESESELYLSAVSQLRDTAPADELTISQLETFGQVELGDIIGIRDRLIGVATNAEVIGKIYRTSKGKTTSSITVMSLMGA